MGRSEFNIRMALPADAAEIASVLHECFIEYENSYTAEAFAATTPTAESIQARLNEGPIWVAILADSIVGTVSAVPGGQSVYVRGMAVLPKARGRKLGEALLQHVEAYAYSHGYKLLVLSTTPFLSRAIWLYELAGFIRSDGGPHDLYGTPLFTMEKALC